MKERLCVVHIYSMDNPLYHPLILLTTRRIIAVRNQTNADCRAISTYRLTKLIKNIASNYYRIAKVDTYNIDVTLFDLTDNIKLNKILIILC